MMVDVPEGIVAVVDKVESGSNTFEIVSQEKRWYDGGCIELLKGKHCVVYAKAQ